MKSLLRIKKSSDRSVYKSYVRKKGKYIGSIYHQNAFTLFYPEKEYNEEECRGLRSCELREIADYIDMLDEKRN